LTASGGPQASYTGPMQRPTQRIPGPQKRPAHQQPISILDGMLGNAIKHHRQGRLPDAERMYRQILSIDSRHAGSLHMLGTLAHEVGRQDIAVQLILTAIGIDPGQAAYYSNLGTILQAQGKLSQAAAAYERALGCNPKLAEAQMNLGTVLQAQGKPEQAAARFRSALALKPDLAEAYVNLGNILQSQGKLADAVASHDRALAFKPDFAEAYFNRGNALQAQGKLDDAVASFRRALALKPGMPEAHGNMGNALLAQKRLDEAVHCYECALALKPDYAEAHYNLGNARKAQDLLAEAAACFQRALDLKPNLPEAHYNLGNTRQEQNDLEAAAVCLERAIALKPEYAEAHYNLACILQLQGRLDEALPYFQRAVCLKPDYAQARFGQALARIQSGDFTEGWGSYESRWQSTDHGTPMRDYTQPLWTGEPLSSGRLLLWGEQGVGDEIMFASLIPDAICTGNRITLECGPRLQTLFARSFPTIEVVSSTQPPSASVEEGELAAHLPIGSLPGLFRTNLAAFAGSTSSYLVPDPIERDRFRDRYSDGRRLVGLAWHTRNQKTGLKRSIDLSELAPLFALPGIRWISLQYGDFEVLEQQAAQADAPILFDRSVDQLADIDRFAAQIAAMDHVVTIDNSTAHLAGALGLPVWVMLPFAADWRWLRTRHDSPWYSSMRLFRQPTSGDWESVLHSVHSALAFATK
jgi:tetratricopeptide (TPR) repeat protein